MGHKLHEEYNLQGGAVIEHGVEFLVVGGLGAGGRRGGGGASDVAATNNTHLNKHHQRKRTLRPCEDVSLNYVIAIH